VVWVKAEYDVDTTSSRISAWLRKQRLGQGNTVTLKKTRPDSKLGMLEPEQQDQVYAQCGGLTLEEGVQWLEAELKIKLSRQALSVWLKKRRLEKAMEPRIDKIRETRDSAILIGKVVGAAAAITDANIVMITQAVFEQLMKPEGQRDEKLLAEYMDFALKARGQDFTAERFRFDIARKVRENSAEVEKINRGDGDEREKTQKAIELLFGLEPGAWVVDEPKEAA
jgi:hypothetical protein